MSTLKKTVCISCVLFLQVISINLYAQIPQGINYQSIIRTTSGSVLTNSAVTVDFKLYDGMLGALLYHETHSTTTNQYGMVNLIIGQGTQLGGSIPFIAIPWASGIAYEVLVNSNVIGTKQLFMSVPYALHSRAPIVTYSNNILSVGGNTATINSSPTYSAGTGIDISGNIISNTLTPITPTITSSGIAVVTPTTGNNFNVSVPAPVLNYNQSTKELSISQGTATSTQTLIGTGTNTISMTGVGIASVSPTVGNNFTVNVQSPTFTNNGPSTIVGTYPNYTLNSTASPTTTLVQGNNITLNQSGNTYTVSSPSQSLSLSSNVLSITGGNSVTLPATVINGVGTGISTVSTTANNFTVNVPKPTYSSVSGILSFGGTNTVSITSPLSLSGTTLTSGVASNSVNLATLPSLWSTATTSVATSIFPTGIGNRVGIGTSTPNSLFEVQDYINFEGVGSNTSLGHLAGVKASPLGYYNTFVGGFAGQAVTTTTGTAAANTYIGYNSGVNASLGNNNTFVGSSSGSSITTGSQNTFLGNISGNGITTGNNNVIIGQGAGVNQTTASNNVFIGNGSGLSTTTQYTNATAIGYNARVNADNALVLGNTTTSVGIGVTAPVEKLEVNGNVQIDGTTSEYKYGTTKTRYLSVPSKAFISESGNLFAANSIVGQIYSVATNTLPLGYATYYIAPVYLPDGAVVTNLDAYVVDEDATYNISLAQLWRSTSTVGTAYGTASIMAQTSATTGSNPNIQLLSDNSVNTPIIDNQNYSYYVRFGGVYTATPQNIRLSRFVITYTVDKAD